MQKWAPLLNVENRRIKLFGPDCDVRKQGYQKLESIRLVTRVARLSSMWRAADPSADAYITRCSEDELRALPSYVLAAALSHRDGSPDNRVAIAYAQVLAMEVALCMQQQ